MLVTVEHARTWLRQPHPDNRPLELPKAARYAHLLTEQLWGDGETPIEFRDGLLINGQHRLLAMVLAGVSRHMDVMGGPACR